MSNYWNALKQRQTEQKEADKNQYWEKLMQADYEHKKKTMSQAEFYNYLQNRLLKLSQLESQYAHKPVKVDESATVSLSLLIQPDIEKGPGQRIETLLPVVFYKDAAMTEALGTGGLATHGSNAAVNFTDIRPGSTMTIYVKNPNRALMAELGLKSQSRDIEISHPDTLAPDELSAITIAVGPNATGNVRATISGRIRWFAVR